MKGLLIGFGLLRWIESACEEYITIAEEFLSFYYHYMWRSIVMVEEVYSAQH
jgi:hypothetical protein